MGQYAGDSSRYHYDQRGSLGEVLRLAQHENDERDHQDPTTDAEHRRHQTNDEAKRGESEDEKRGQLQTRNTPITARIDPKVIFRFPSLMFDIQRAPNGAPTRDPRAIEAAIVRLTSPSDA